MNEELDFLKTLFSGGDQPVEVFPFLMQLLITVILSLLVGFFYIKHGSSLSNRKALSKVFVLVSLTTWSVPCLLFVLEQPSKNQKSLPTSLWSSLLVWVLVRDKYWLP